MIASRIRCASLLALFAIAAMLCALLHPDNPLPIVLASESHPASPLAEPDKACASCHREIYDKYEQTSMARGSGLAVDHLIPGKFKHEPSGIEYRVFARDGSAWMSYTRAATDPRGALSGERRLEDYIGSGHRGRTYLYNEEGRWYELPINFYTRRRAWDMAPAFDNATTMPAPLPADPNCLHCHATDVQPSLQDARNHYADVPFRQGGIGCSACHGDPAKHLAQQGHGPIVNPAKLPVAQRDSACIQCHLEGDAVVYRRNRSLAQFVPGDNLSDIAVYFVRATQQSGGARATSQYEALLRSACKRATGDRLTCTTCHDPHFDPPPAQRVEYYRERCLTCHTAPAMATHHIEQKDCAQCHMPTRNTVDISHEQVTDHDIEARPATRPSSPVKNIAEAELLPVGNVTAGDREFGLAYAQLAQRGNRKAAQIALRLLSKLPLTDPDIEVSVRLGYLQQVAGESASARASYATALKINPWEPTALTNLAVLDAGSGKLPEAIHLLQRLVDADPTQTAASLNLAFIQCRLNHPKEARALLTRLLQSNPDDPQLNEFLHTGTYADQRCSVGN